MATPAADVRSFYDLGHQGDVDRTQLARALALTPDQRLRRHEGWRPLLKGAAVEPTFIADTVNRLCDAGVEFVIAGGVSAVLHGSPVITNDLDLCYRRTPDNVRRLVAALAPLNPRPRGFPPDLPFAFDERTVLLGSNFTLAVGPEDLDLLGTMSAVGGYEQVIGAAADMTVAGRPVKVLALTDLIASKEAAGRPKDVAVLPLLRALLAARAGGGPPV
ncbi:MAG TPA: hypothetical protein VGF55_22875 [Gemmataceae bacterium]|jgi:hypothetical protein